MNLRASGDRCKVTNRSERGIGLLDSPRVAPDHTANGLSVQRSRKSFHRRNAQKGKPAIQLDRSRRQKIRIPAEHFGRLVERPEGRSPHDRINRMQTKLERSDHAEVAAAATDRPEKIRKLICIDRHETAVGEDQVGFDEAVNS